MPFQYDQSGEMIQILQGLNRPGMVTMWAGSSAPGGWLFIDGSELNPVDFPDLFLAIGFTFNTGGETPGFFRIPNGMSRSPICVGAGAGLSAYTLGQYAGEENHVLTIAELASHTHLQNSHNHLQDSHNHLQNSHNHLQDAHTHLQDAHTHTQNAHTHTQDSHNHKTGVIAANTANARSAYNSYGSNTSGLGPQYNGVRAASEDTTVTPHSVGVSESKTVLNQNTTAVNQNTTAVNQNTTATNQISTAVNNPETATNQATTALNQNEGADVAHNTIHPVIAFHFIIKY